ncbi:MAG: cyclic nucleotide-binding domain-containing protein [Deltaproteobacteria bacterium]|nr:cyclic nucleotide-binding domain-containing protein [Deltaproteobacteria bacterium]
MPLLESAGEHRPVFYHPQGTTPRRLELPVPEQLDVINQIPLFADILDEVFEKRPVVAADGKKQIRDLLVRDALLEHAEYYEVPTGTVIFQEGSFGEHLFFILKGEVRTSTHVSVDTERQAEVLLADLRHGEYLGEMSVLSMNAHLFAATTSAPTRLMLVPQFIAQELTATQERFRVPIMQTYVSRAVQTLIRRIPILRFSEPADITRLLSTVELRTFEVGEIIFEEGDPADNGDCSKDTGFIQPVHDAVMRGVVDGLHVGLLATYPAPSVH